MHRFYPLDDCKGLFLSVIRRLYTPFVAARGVYAMQKCDFRRRGCHRVGQTGHRAVLGTP